MKAKTIDNKIELFRQTPKEIFIQADDEWVQLDTEAKLKANGFYDVVDPAYNHKIEDIGDIEFDATNKVFIYPVVDRTLDIDKIKATLLREMLDEEEKLQNAARRYERRMQHEGKTIPTAFKTKVTAIYTKIDALETYIDGETDAKKLAVYELPYAQIETMIKHFRGLRT